MANKSYLDTILEYLSPGEAQAKIRGTPEAMELVSNLWADAEKNKNEYLPGMYNRIYRAAEDRPQEVHVRPAPELNAMKILGKHVAPNELVKRHSIYYDPNPPKEFEGGLSNTIPHELIHFLNHTSGRPQNISVQHDLIYKLIGGILSGPGATGAVKGSIPAPFTPIEQSILEQWLQKNPRLTER